MPDAAAFPDDARRIADEMTLHTIAGSAGMWAAFRMSDGQPIDHVAYERREDAVRAAKHDRDTTVYLEIQPDGMTPREAQAFLSYARMLHDAGFRLPSPDFDFDASMPAFGWDQRAKIRHLASGGKH